MHMKLLSFDYNYLFTTHTKLTIYPSLIPSIDAFLNLQDYDLLSIILVLDLTICEDICHHVERFAMNFTDIEAINLQVTLVNTLLDKSFYSTAWKLPLHAIAFIQMLKTAHLLTPQTIKTIEDL
ncbi:hypothetical protein WICANDRAFT_106506 [Wickerhamomyces anomalus NRRL Y-366-8]|uniref:Uncharacterized protein n=1 Tax=Wickerhamomyces anomalus (strain ATCC 58044 / CBS 1984 / NCYC 433 / NRRL Y-366-8) TaxID=683960 RepID=A0A1E3NYD9_WICAA|nr:uncharacterized protein WICANDRAFT_106506 [Wickerhamomyces anomalus NRRL Y-366-8]ODQ58115.1 hypothetical protein WICANDRAFT_106506 [Wickerhamomyces anomalus NRRL Y-366-8]